MRKHDKKTYQYLVAFAAALLITSLIALGTLHRLDELAQGLLFQRPGITETSILVIGIDEEATDVLGSTTPGTEA